MSLGSLRCFITMYVFEGNLYMRVLFFLVCLEFFCSTFFSSFCWLSSPGVSEVYNLNDIT